MSGPEFRRLLPDGADGLSAADVVGEIAPALSDERPWIALNMIASADGRATVQGRTAELANAGDKALFHWTRTLCDAVLVGAETVRVEGYRELIREDALRDARERAGLEREPLAVVPSRRLELPTETGLLSRAENRVVIVTPDPEGTLPPCAAQVAYIRAPDLAAGLRALRAGDGVRTVVCEGGPALNASLLPAGLVDELHLVYAAKLVGGPAPLTVLSGPSLDPPLELDLLSLHECGGYLFARYGVLNAAA